MNFLDLQSGAGSAGDTPSHPAEQGQPLSEQAKTEAADFSKKLVESKEKYQKKVEELFNQTDSRGSIGRKNLELLEARQKKRYEKIAEEKAKKYNEILQMKHAEREKLLLGEAETEFERIYQPLERIMKFVKGHDLQLDDQELVKLEAFLTAVSKLETNPENEKMFLKILTQEKLTESDLQFIFDACHELDLSVKVEEGPRKREVFEASQAGAMLGAMSDSQKMEFCTYMIEKKYPKQQEKVKGLIGSLYVNEVLSLDQLQELNKRMPPELKAYFEAMLTDPEFQKKREEYQKFLHLQQVVNEGRTAKNPVLQLWGKPGLFALASLWGALTAFINLGTTFDRKNILGSLGQWISGWGGIGLLAGAGGGLGLGSILSPDLRKKMSGVLGSSPGEEAESFQRKSEIYDLYGKNPPLRDWLKTEIQMEGTEGKPMIFEFLSKEIEARLAKDPDTKKLQINDLIEKVVASNNPEQKKIFERCIYHAGGIQKFSEMIKEIMLKFRFLKVKNGTEYLAFNEQYKKDKSLA